MISALLFLTIASFSFGADVSHDLFTDLLQDHVRSGLVDYKVLKKDPRLDRYIGMISEVDPDTLGSEDAEKAFYINVYNAFTLKILVDNYPLSSITDLNDGGLIISTLFKKTVWDKKLVRVDGKKTTLNVIEHEILRAVYKDFRIHFAIVCGALSCPPLLDEAYTADKLDSQLNDQGQVFFSNPGLNSFDLDNRVAYLA